MLCLDTNPAEIYFTKKTVKRFCSLNFSYTYVINLNIMIVKGNDSFVIRNSYLSGLICCSVDRVKLINCGICYKDTLKSSQLITSAHGDIRESRPLNHYRQEN